ncbi:MAG: sel1 repeat family protein [Candidatus Riflebacteria bacterium]|nr:sel1 repeat family protein [Candidatus Riflebacteria bacterium]
MNIVQTAFFLTLALVTSANTAVGAEASGSGVFPRPREIGTFTKPLKMDPNLESGLKFMEGDGVPQDFSKALPLIKKSAEQSNVEAQFYLAYIYLHGQGSTTLPIQTDLGYAWLQNAAFEGHVKAQYCMGRLLSDGVTGLSGKVKVAQDYEAAKKWFSTAADRGDHEARQALDLINSTGMGVTDTFKKGKAAHLRQKYTEALKLLTSVAMIDHSEAQFMVGAMYSFGYGVPQNNQEAKKWYLKSIESGEEILSELNLGYLYLSGEGFPADLTEAYYWFGRAGANGLKAGEHMRQEISSGWKAALFYRMTSEQVAEAERRLTEWKNTKKRLIFKVDY